MAARQSSCIHGYDSEGCWRHHFLWSAVFVCFAFVCKLRASARLSHIGYWFNGWVSESVFSARKGCSSVEAWYTSFRCLRLLALFNAFSFAMLVSVTRRCCMLVDGKVRERWCGFCGDADSHGHVFWECVRPPLCSSRCSPEFAELVGSDG